MIRLRHLHSSTPTAHTEEGQTSDACHQRLTSLLAAGPRWFFWHLTHAYLGCAAPPPLQPSDSCRACRALVRLER